MDILSSWLLILIIGGVLIGLLAYLGNRKNKPAPEAAKSAIGTGLFVVLIFTVGILLVIGLLLLFFTYWGRAEVGA